MHVNTFENDRLHPEPDYGKNLIFSFSCSARLTRHSLNVSPWVTHKSVLFCNMQVHDVIVFDECHLDHCQMYQWYMPTALIEDAILKKKERRKEFLPLSGSGCRRSFSKVFTCIYRWRITRTFRWRWLECLITYLELRSSKRVILWATPLPLTLSTKILTQ